MFERRQFSDLRRHRRRPVGVGPRLVSAATLMAAALMLPSVLAYGQTPYQAAKGNITFALTGDSIISRPLSAYVEPEFLAMVEAIRGADLAFTNLEIALQTVDKLTPMVSDRESYMFAHPSIAGELAWAGFDAVSRANNHALDYGWDGMRATNRALDEAGVAYAGVGENLALADEASYVQTGNGRVALISTRVELRYFPPGTAATSGHTSDPGAQPDPLSPHHHVGRRGV